MMPSPLTILCLAAAATFGALGFLAHRIVDGFRNSTLDTGHD